MYMCIYLHKYLWVYIVFHQGDIYRNVYTAAQQRSIFEKSKFSKLDCVHMFWLISVLSLMPKGEIVGIKLLLPLVTTLIHINIAIKLNI